MIPNKNTGKFIRRICLLALLPFSVLLLSNTLGYDYQRLGYVQRGKASYYATKFHGRPTASGEKYNMYDETAAHKRIPFNSLVEVINQKNGKSTIVRINDRGPYKGGRVIDLSYKSAKKLDMVRDGVVDIKLKVLRVGAHGQRLEPETIKSKPTTTKKRKWWKPRRKTKAKVRKPNKYLPQIFDANGSRKYPKQYGVQIGSYYTLKNAYEKGQVAIRKGEKEVYIRAAWTKDLTRRVFRVSIGDLSAKEAAKKAQTMRRKGFEGCFPKAHFND